MIKPATNVKLETAYNGANTQNAGILDRQESEHGGETINEKS